MSGFRLELPEMGTPIETLTDAADRIAAANQRLRNTSAGDLGSPHIDGAGRDFQDRWEHGIEQIAEATGRIVTELAAARNSYQVVDRELARLFPPDVQPDTAPPPAAEDGEIAGILDGDS